MDFKRVTLKASVFEDVKANADAIAREKRLTTSAWVQMVLVEAIDAHRAEKAQKGVAA